MKPEVLRRKQEEMRSRQAAARRQPIVDQRREREQQAWEAGRTERKREGYCFVAMGNYLRASERRMKLERYVTAMWGCKTSWRKIEEHGKYYSYAKSDRRAERPVNGGKWSFNPRTPASAPVRAPLAA
jgi:hypothetical protein